jgi:hypothetical protein
MKLGPEGTTPSGPKIDADEYGTKIPEQLRACIVGEGSL